MLHPVRAVNLAFKFLLELAAVAALAYAGASLGSGVGAIVLAIVLPVVAVVVWGRWCAPRSPHRLGTPARIPLELAVFVAAGVLLLVAGAVLWGNLFLVLVVLNATLLTALRQWES
jgi:hypothetical protein